MSTAPLCVLIVDDEPVLRRSLGRLITHMGGATFSAANGAAALELVAAHPELTAVLLDLRLPGGMTGLVVAKQLRALRPDLPVLMMTGDADARVPVELARDPRVGLLGKPFDRRALEQILSQLIDGKRD